MTCTYQNIGNSNIATFTMERADSKNQKSILKEQYFYLTENAFQNLNKDRYAIHLKPLRIDNEESWKNYMEICKGQRIASIRQIGKDIILAIHKKYKKSLPKSEKTNVSFVVNFKNYSDSFHFNGIDFCDEKRYDGYLNTIYGHYLNYCAAQAD